MASSSVVSALKHSFNAESLRYAVFKTWDTTAVAHQLATGRLHEAS